MVAPHQSVGPFPIALRHLIRKSPHSNPSRLYSALLISFSKSVRSAVPLSTAGTTFRRLGGTPSFRAPDRQLPPQALLPSACPPQENRLPCPQIPAPLAVPLYLLSALYSSKCNPGLLARLVYLLIREGKPHLPAPSGPTEPQPSVARNVFKGRTRRPEPRGPPQVFLEMQPCEDEGDPWQGIKGERGTALSLGRG